MHRECQKRFPARLQRKSLVSDPGMHHDTCITRVSWCMSRSLTRSGEENVLGIPGACATRNFTYLARGPMDKAMVRDKNKNKMRAVLVKLKSCCNDSLHSILVLLLSYTHWFYLHPLSDSHQLYFVIDLCSNTLMFNGVPWSTITSEVCYCVGIIPKMHDMDIFLAVFVQC